MLCAHICKGFLKRKLETFLKPPLEIGNSTFNAAFRNLKLNLFIVKRCPYG